MISSPSRLVGLAVIAALFCSGCKPSSGGSAPAPTPTPPTTPVPAPRPPTILDTLRAVPITEVYSREGVTIEFHDGHENPAYRYTEDEKRVLRSVLNKLPIDHLRSIQYIGTLPDIFTSHGTAFAAYAAGFIAHVYTPSQAQSARAWVLHGEPASEEAESTGERVTTQQTKATDIGGLRAFGSATLHEIGHHVYRNVLQPQEWEEWVSFHQNSTDNSDYAPPTTGGTNGGPYGNVTTDEDAATVYAEFASRPQIALLNALDAYQRNGRTLIIQKYLHAMSLFSNPRDGVMNFTWLDPVTNELTINPTPYVRTGNLFSFRITCGPGSPSTCLAFDMSFTLSNNQITRIEYSEPRGGSPRRIILNPNPPIPLPQTFHNRIPPRVVVGAQSLQAGSGASATGASSIGVGQPGFGQTTATGDASQISYGDFLEEISHGKVISPRSPTEYEILDTLELGPDRKPIPPTLTMQEMLKQHGKFELAK